MDERLREELLAFLPRLRRFTRGLTGSVEAGDDLLQAACERAIRFHGRFEAGTRLDHWMYRLARNLYLNERRAESRRPVVSLETAPIDGEASEDGREVVESRLNFAAVRDCLADLPADQREILLLVTVEGLSYQEVAETLELPMGTVASRLARARFALKAALDERDSPNLRRIAR